MATALTPLITQTPAATATYNPQMAETFSWVPVTNSVRPLYAKATYDVGIAQFLGQNGFVVTNANDTATYSGPFTTLTTLTTTKFSGLSTDPAQTIGNAITTINLPANFTIRGPITAFNLVYGAVIAYKA